MPLNLLKKVNSAITNDWCKCWSGILRLSLAQFVSFVAMQFFQNCKASKQTHWLRETVANNQQLSIYLARHNSGLLYSKLIFQKNQQVIIILFIYLISRRASFFLISSIKNKIFLFILNHPFYFYKSLYPLTFLGTKKDHTLQYDPFY